MRRRLDSGHRHSPPIGRAPRHPTWNPFQEQFKFADDFSGINPIGAEIAKADIIASAGSLDYEPESIVNDVRRVRVFDGVAVVTAQGSAKGKYRGQRADMVFVYTRIWVKREGVWQAVAAHASPVG